MTDRKKPVVARAGPKMVKTALDDSISKLAAQADQKTLATWACDCVDRVLGYFEKQCPGDERPRLAIQAARQWIIDGVFSMPRIRKASLAAHRAASEVKEIDAAGSAARAAGQAVATAHVRGHALAAAIDAATAVRDRTQNIDAEADVQKERDWQYRRLLEMIEQSNDF